MIDDSPDKFIFEDFTVVVDTSLPEHLTEVMPAEIPVVESMATDLSIETHTHSPVVAEPGNQDITQSIEAFIANEERGK